eukprot:4721457-Amphidinium_carterae.1
MCSVDELYYARAGAILKSYCISSAAQSADVSALKTVWKECPLHAFASAERSQPLGVPDLRFKQCCSLCHTLDTVRSQIIGNSFLMPQLMALERKSAAIVRKEAKRLKRFVAHLWTPCER